MRKCKPQYKEMAFETAVRNPERYKIILKCLHEFEGKTLNDETLLEIVSKLTKNGIIKLKDKDITKLTNDEIKSQIIITNSTRKADGGFPSGYASRFWTYMRTPSELGFVYACYNEPFLFSPIALNLINDKIDEQTIFANQAVIFNRKSPYRNVLNDYNYFKFIVKTLIELWRYEKGLTIEQFILSLFSKTGNTNDFLNELKSFKCNDLNTTYSYLKTNYRVKTKFRTVCKDYPDAVLRLLRITGFITIKYSGKLIIQINEDQIEYINSIFSNEYIFSDCEKENKKLFFNKYSTFSSDLLEKMSKMDIYSKVFDYSAKMRNLINNYNINEEKIINSIKSLPSNNAIEIFKYIPDSIKLEFFISLLLYLKFGDSFIIKPNYKPDSNGLPISQAPGGKGDIELSSDNVFWLIEVTLIRNRFQQFNNETANIIRHLQKTNKEKYLTLVAPVIHEDTKTFFDNQILNFIRDDKIVYIKPYTINSFIQDTINKNILLGTKEYTNSIIKETIDKIKTFNAQ